MKKKIFMGFTYPFGFASVSLSYTKLQLMWMEIPHMEALAFHMFFPLFQICRNVCIVLVFYEFYDYFQSQLQTSQQ